MRYQYNLLIFFLLLALSGTTSFAHPGPGIQWQNTIGGTVSDVAEVIRQTSDGGYVVAGISQSGISGDKTDVCRGLHDYWVIKTDANGTIAWQSTIGGSSVDALYAVQQTSDGGYVLGGFSSSPISGDKTEDTNGGIDFWVIKLDSLGYIQWQNTIGGSAQDQLYSVVQTTDGGYLLGGSSGSSISGDKADTCRGITDYWILKLDSAGAILWQKTIGGNGEDNLHELQQTTDGGFILCGTSTSNISGDKTVNTHGVHDYWLVKTDTVGQISWQKSFGGSGVDYFESLQQTRDGGYILGGWSDSNISGDKTENCMGGYDYWMVYTDSLGNIRWENTIGGNGNDFLRSVRQTHEGGFVAGGYSDSDSSSDKSEDPVGGQAQDYWIVKTDSLGNRQWDNSIGGYRSDNETYVSPTQDGGYILSGASISGISGDKTEANLDTTLTPSNDYWIVKLYPDPLTSTFNIQPTPYFQVFANPAGDFITLQFPIHPSRMNEVDIFDLLGHQVLHLQTSNPRVDVSSLVPGVYIVSIRMGRDVFRQQFVKQ